MKWLLLIRPRSESDLESARDWYEQKSPPLAAAFFSAGFRIKSSTK